LTQKCGVDGSVARAVKACDGIDEDAEEFGEGESVVVATPAMEFKEVVENLVGGKVSPQTVERLGQGKTIEDPKGEGILRCALGLLRGR
jgi:hypothetical protein